MGSPMNVGSASEKDLLVSKIHRGARSKEKNFGPLARFFEQKSVLINNKFLVTFFDDPDNNIAKKDLYETIGYMPALDFYHIKNVTLPSNQQFSSETLFMDNFCVIDNYQVAGELTVVLEEDQFGTVAKFINWCQRKLITKSGIMRSKVVQTISSLTVDVTNLQDRVVAQYIYSDIYYLNSDILSLSYDGGEAIQYSITFNFGDNQYVPLVGESGNITQTGTTELENPLKNIPNS